MDKKPLSELVNESEHAWSAVLDWLKGGRNKYEILGAERSKAETVLLELQVTTRSPMGAIALESGGILIDHGWLKILGSGNERIHGDLLYWNGLGQVHIQYPLQNSFIIAYDAVGGFFAINGGAFEGEMGSVFYFAPDTLQWEDLQTSYSGFIQWTVLGDLDLFYKVCRWDGWMADLRRMRPEQGMNFYPPLWTIGDAYCARSKKPIPIEELWELHKQG